MVVQQRLRRPSSVLLKTPLFGLHSPLSVDLCPEVEAGLGRGQQPGQGEAKHGGGSHHTTGVQIFFYTDILYFITGQDYGWLWLWSEIAGSFIL